MERTLVLIKPDAVQKGLTGNIISEIQSLDLRIVGLKVVNVQRELAEKHYIQLKDKPFFEDLVKHITGELHGKENVVAIVFKGDNAISKIRVCAGETNPENASPGSLRGKYGRIHSETKCFENVLHASDSTESADKEISLWFEDEELVD